MATTTKKETKTEHPHIIMVPGVCGGRPTIRGTRISVDFIARFHRKGVEPWEIIAMYPHLNPSAVYDAISYYLDHAEELEPFVEEITAEEDAKRHGWEIGDKGPIIFKRP